MRNNVNLVKKVIICAALAAMAVSAAACSKKGPSAQIREEVGSLAFTQGIVAFGSVKSLTDLTTAATDLGSAFNKGLGPLIGGQVTALIQAKALGTRNLTWMDPAKPIRIVLLDPAAHKVPLAIIAPVASDEGLTAALNDAKKDAEGNETSYSGTNGMTMFLNRIEKHAVFTMEPGAFAAVREFATNMALNYPGTELIDLQGSSAGLKTMLKPVVDSRKAAVDPQLPKLMDLLTGQLEAAVNALEQTKAVRLVLRFDGKSLTVEGSALAAEGSEAAKFAADGTNRKLSLYKKIPTEGWLEAAYNLDPALFKGFSAQSLESMASIAQLTPEEKAAYEKLLADAIASQTGESVVWVGSEGKFPFKMLQVSGLSDGEKGKATIDGIYDLLFAKIGRIATSKMPAGTAEAPAPAFDWTSIETLLASSKEYLGGHGVVAELKKGANDGADVRAIDFTIDSGKLAADDPDLLKFKEAIGDRLSVGIGFDKAAMYFAFGRNSTDDIGKLRASRDAGSAKLDNLIKNAGYDVAVAARLSFVDAARIAAVVNSRVASTLPALATTQDRPDITVLAGSREGKAIIASLSVPVAGIAALMTPPAPAPATGSQPAVQ